MSKKFKIFARLNQKGNEKREENEKGFQEYNESLLEELNEPQREAVLSTEGFNTASSFA